VTDKYTFRREYTDLYGQTKTIEHTLEGETLDEIVEGFLYFFLDYESNNADPQTAEDLNQLTLELSDIMQRAEDDVNLDNIIQKYSDK